MGLEQHGTQPTHESGNTLDLVINKAAWFDYKTISYDWPLSDHATVFCQLNISKQRANAKNVSYRKLNSINVDALRKDLEQSELCTRQFSDLDQLTYC